MYPAGGIGFEQESVNFRIKTEGGIHQVFAGSSPLFVGNLLQLVFLLAFHFGPVTAYSPMCRNENYFKKTIYVKSVKMPLYPGIKLEKFVSYSSKF